MPDYVLTALRTVVASDRHPIKKTRWRLAYLECDHAEWIDQAVKPRPKRICNVCEAAMRRFIRLGEA